MQSGRIVGAAGAFFNAIGKRIICIIGICFGGVVGRFRGGVAYWRGNVSGGWGVGQQRGGGFNSEYRGASQGVLFAESSALLGLAVGLPGNAEAGGGVAVDWKAAGEGVKQTFHNHASINKPRNRVLLVGSCGVVQCGAGLCQLVVDRPKEGQSVFSMPR